MHPDQEVASARYHPAPVQDAQPAQETVESTLSKTHQAIGDCHSILSELCREGQSVAEAQSVEGVQALSNVIHGNAFDLRDRLAMLRSRLGQV